MDSDRRQNDQKKRCDYYLSPTITSPGFRGRSENQGNGRRKYQQDEHHAEAGHDVHCCEWMFDHQNQFAEHRWLENRIKLVIKPGSDEIYDGKHGDPRRFCR